jgi:ribosomal protein S27E
MPMLLNCDKKGCRSYDEHVLDIATNEVRCIKCNEIIPNISHFTKQQLKSLKQTKKSAKSAYAVRCGKCKVETLPKLDAANKLVCGSCGDVNINVSKIFEPLIRDAIKNGNKDIV